MTWLLVLISMSGADADPADRNFYAGFESEQACEKAGEGLQSIFELSAEPSSLEIECHPFLGQS